MKSSLPETEFPGMLPENIHVTKKHHEIGSQNYVFLSVAGGILLPTKPNWMLSSVQVSQTVFSLYLNSNLRFSKLQREQTLDANFSSMIEFVVFLFWDLQNNLFSLLYILYQTKLLKFRQKVTSFLFSSCEAIFAH